MLEKVLVAEAIVSASTAVSNKVGDRHHIAKLLPSRDSSASNGPSASSPSSSRAVFPENRSVEDLPEDLTDQDLARFTDEVAIIVQETTDDHQRQQSPPPRYPALEASPSIRPAPPPFSSLFPPLDHSAAALAVLEPCEPYKASVSDAETLLNSSSAAPAYAPSEPVVPGSSNSRDLQDETKRALPRDTKAGPSRSKDDEAEPPPAYSEGSSPLQSFTYLMAAAGGAASIITQVQQGGPTGGINSIGGRDPSCESWMITVY